MPKVSHWGRQLPWLRRKLSQKLKHKIRLYGLWKKGRTIQEEYKDVVRLCVNKI